jgi:photosystem II stability/assembly factor-like uncharacterized protein
MLTKRSLRRNVNRLILFLAATLAVVTALWCSSGRAGIVSRGAASGPGPACTQISGADSVAFTRDGGKTIVRSTAQMNQHTYNGKIAVVHGNPELMLLIEEGKLLQSKDSGCTWSAFPMQSVPNPWTGKLVNLGDFKIVATGPTTALAVEDRNRHSNNSNIYLLAVLDATHLKMLVKTPVEVGAIATEQTDDHLRIVSRDDGDLWTSSDSGLSWKHSGVPSGARRPLIFATADFAPKSPRVIVAYTGSGVWVSANGGGAWAQATGVPNDAVVDQIVSSPVDDNVVWLIARYGAFYRSSDGGRTFHSFHAPAEPMAAAAADPRDAAVLHFSDTSGVLYRYNAQSGLSKQRLPSSASSHVYVEDISFPAADPSVMFLSLSKSGIMN